MHHNWNQRAATNVRVRYYTEDYQGASREDDNYVAEARYDYEYRRWLDLGFIRFQPSEIMKLAVPMMAAWYLHERPLPPRLRELAVLGVLFNKVAGMDLRGVGL